MTPYEVALITLARINAEAALLVMIEFMKPCPAGGEHEAQETGPHAGHYCFMCTKCDWYGKDALHIHVNKATGKVM